VIREGLNHKKLSIMTTLKTFKVSLAGIECLINQLRDYKTGEIFYQSAITGHTVSADTFWNLNPIVLQG
jgi:hypothetical protein